MVVMIKLFVSVLAEDRQAFEFSKEPMQSDALPIQRIVDRRSQHASTLWDGFARMRADPHHWWARQYKNVWKGFKIGLSPFIWVGTAILSGGPGAAIGGALVAEVWKETAGASISSFEQKNFRTAASGGLWNERPYSMLFGGGILLGVLSTATLFYCLGFLAAKWRTWNYRTFAYSGRTRKILSSVSFLLAKQPICLPH
jgi:hypothetical protein